MLELAADNARFGKEEQRTELSEKARAIMKDSKTRPLDLNQKEEETEETRK